MTDVLVRHATPDDIASAIAVWQTASIARQGGQPILLERETSVRSSIQRPGAFLLVADDVDTGQIVGMGLAESGLANDGAGPPEPGLCFISLIYVAPDRWGEGIGGKIIDALCTEACTRGYTHAQLWTHSDNMRARRLYESHGFQYNGRTQEDERGNSIVQYESML